MFRKTTLTRMMLAAAITLTAGNLNAQTRSFKQGQWIEIETSLMHNLTRYYVDTLPVDKMYKDGIKAMLENLDPYTVYVPQEEQEDFTMMISNTYGGIGAIIHKPTVESNVIINEPYANSPAAIAGLRCGDEILSIDGQSVKGLSVAQSSSKMKGKPGTEVKFQVKKVRSGEIVEYVIRREKIHLPDIEYYGMLDSRTGYIYQSGFTIGVAKEMKKAILELKERGMKRLVLDLRGNGGGLLEEAVEIVGLFVPKGTLVVTSKGTDGINERRTPLDPIDTDLPLLVMVDSGSASASEIVAGAIQDLDRGTIAGRRSFGKGLVQQILPLAYNGQLKVTIAKYYTPSGRCVQAKDYSHRQEDGSVGNIPDSLIREFKTAGGRIVKDGGGITPDIDVPARKYDRITYSVVMNGLTSNWPIEYVAKHDTIAPVESFKLTDQDYEDFVNWACTKTFDSRSEAKTYFDLLKKELKEDGLLEDGKDAMASLEKIVNMDKKTALMRSKSQIMPLLEEEVAVRYHFQAAGVLVRLRTDDQLHEAVKRWEETSVK